MKLIVVLLTLLAVGFAEELDLQLEHKKRGVAKSSSINSISSNGHQKPEQVQFNTYQQAATQAPLYPIAPTSYPAEALQPNPNQQMYNFLPPQSQVLPFPIFSQPLNVPKYQLVATKSANGQTQLTLVPQNMYMSPHSFNPSPSFLQLQQPLSNNHLTTSHPSSSSGFHSTSSATQATHSTPTSSYSTQTTSNPNFLSQSFFSHPSYSHLAQPSTMFIFAQPAPQLYNNYAQQPPLYFNPQTQQLLNYYQNQGKNQLVYSNQPTYQQSQVNSYQTPISAPEYEKPVQHSTSQKAENDISLNTNEYVNQAETQFRPIPSYGQRSQTTYKN